MKHFFACFLLLSIVLSLHPKLFGQTDKVFKTKYTVVYYSQDKDFDDFIWRLGGKRIEFSLNRDLVENRIDRLVQRVENILDMRPKNFSINIYLHKGSLEPNKIAYYEHKTKSIYVSIDNISDGILAHEIAHAIISQYFSLAPSSKVQEILAQYVDKHLWSDY